MLWLGLLALSAIIVLWRAGLAWVLARVLNPYPAHVRRARGPQHRLVDRSFV